MSTAFDNLFEKYLKNSSVSQLQAEFIWNAAIEEATKYVQNEHHRNQLEDECLIPIDRHVAPIIGFVK